MQFNYDKEADIVEYVCPNCGQVVKADCSDFISEQSPNHFGELEYEDFIVDCNCGSTTQFIFKLPEGEYDELLLEEEHFTYEQINLRKQVRDLMWAKRSDLMKLDRDKFNENRIKELPVQIQNLIKRNNIVTMLTGNLNLNSTLNDEQTEVLKNAAMQIVTGQVSLLQAIAALTQYFKQ